MNRLAFFYRQDDTANIDASSDSNVHLEGAAYNVEQITVYDQNGQNPQVFSTNEYRQNPHGYYQHDWPGGIALSLFGLIIGGLAYCLPLKYQKSITNSACISP